MTPRPPGETTLLIEAARGGDDGARERLFELLYEGVRGQAVRFWQREGGGDWRPSDLIQQVMLRLLAGDALGNAPNRIYFFGAAARAMRHAVIDYGRKARLPEGGAPPLEQIPSPARGTDLEALHEAIERLERAEPAQARAVDMYYFGGYKMREIAECLGVSEATVSGTLKRAEQWLRAQLMG
jgi:RNA polymerase sigma factor (TIGR02999 family)